MKCDYCGTQNNDNALFCISCGKNLLPAIELSHDNEQSEEELGFSFPDSEYIKPEVVTNSYCNTNTTEETDEDNTQADIPHRKNNKRLIISVASALILTCLIFYIVYRVQDNYNYNNPENVIEFYPNYNTKETHIFNRKGEVVHNLTEEVYPSYNLNKTSAILTGNSEYIAEGLRSYNLSYVDMKRYVPFDKKVINFALSDNGKFLAYTTYEEDKGFQLWLYDTAKNKQKLLLTSDDHTFIMINISPDGTDITYTMVNYPWDPTEGNIEMEAFLVKNGSKPKSLGFDKLILALSDDAQYIYYSDLTEDMGLKSLYLLKGDEVILIDEDFTVSGHISLNQDYSEVMFMSQGMTYVSRDGNDKQQISDTVVVDFIIPTKAVRKNNLNFLTIYGFETFKNKIFIDDYDNLMFIQEDYQTEKIGIASKSRNICISKDGNNLVYLSPNKSIIKVSDLQGKRSNSKLIELADTLIASDNLSDIYYLNNKKLYYIKEDKETEFLLDHVWDIQWNTDKTAAFLITDNEDKKGRQLYYIKQGNKIKSAFVDQDIKILSFMRLNYGLGIRLDKNDKKMLYYNPGGVKLKRVLVE
ncbi:hypothetical protein I5677_15525 [Mobilitalea sibirica]|uniref:Zinc ribbon domain-containing protein n=1 Tax=Mobilitalea sibirica TaxID=1462919 RepID=A0A8J7HCQ0_9FIRM|nr:hypothetical protein [Mobilitalea sibirica]MBH1942311.1 hypothetical protein [Mobilitalea sibirica]